ncbi:MAG TPA: hypothetical protein PLO37_01015 [Candidatus Hydrogenedentes bacterium]|nr:hypothetical protein [Candidatus Hydrogenedentota bacterium]HPG65395.1 hypothetical protein [Candidatus Hydrogenedentota bacterium]
METAEHKDRAAMASGALHAGTTPHSAGTLLRGEAPLPILKAAS